MTTTALVTGAARGFGLALTAALVARGDTVVVDGRDAAALAAATADLPGPGTVVAVPGDLTDAAHRGALHVAVRRAGGLDLLVHNAGTLGPSPLPRLAELAPHAFADLWETNVAAPLALTRLLLPFLRTGPAGTVVTLSSDAAVEAYPGWGGYGATKAALDQLAAVLGAEEPGLRVYAFDPGDMRTDMHQRAFPGEDISDRPEPATVVPALLGLLRQRPPSGRHRAADLLEATR
ncbi:SDR family NAD(P)-dependent oxidoreductase [Pseudonocardia benzenivorans]|jgi:NAD(P)-dependent dehydrogenase (short-subunit alcohol dehydrogenase family)|uniref:Short-chain dehydrogenase/reductase SDR n=2 Tax=Pseudonocardia TaxID=1847 RepID=F4CU13_PSEUX|nr:SDR family NAD(P)-dependent oxidoreductase [Pseudonocardia dioxanivorans]AEA23421.1 short-chain dehydrogenase/reductase SDR [Pseudonocardia dioxanivorans CB1190]GJF04331.1 short-chain dehydrogenase [Pseudonocardia sp. D17]